MAQRMNEVTALAVLMGNDPDWHDSEDDDIQDNDCFDDQYDPLDLAQIDDKVVQANDDDQCDDNMDISIPSRLSCAFLESVGPVSHTSQVQQHH